MYSKPQVPFSRRFGQKLSDPSQLVQTPIIQNGSNCQKVSRPTNEGPAVLILSPVPDCRSSSINEKEFSQVLYLVKGAKLG